jgi:hypothetical protein
MQSHPNVQFVFFDVATWEVRLFTTPFRGNIAAGMLTEEEVRVKATPSSSIPTPQTPTGSGSGSSFIPINS